jgi:hypothetical protein
MPDPVPAPEAVVVHDHVGDLLDGRPDGAADRLATAPIVATPDEGTGDEAADGDEVPPPAAR